MYKAASVFESQQILPVMVPDLSWETELGILVLQLEYLMELNFKSDPKKQSYGCKSITLLIITSIVLIFFTYYIDFLRSNFLILTKGVCSSASADVLAKHLRMC